MFKSNSLLCSLSKRGVRLWVDGGQLHYRAPVGLLTAEEIASLREMKSEIISVLASEMPATTSNRENRPGLASDLAPLSIQQEGFMQLIEVGRTEELNEMMTFALKLSGALNVEMLRRSLEAVVSRHESLRTKIVVVDGVPKQQIGEPRAYELDILNLSDMPKVDAENKARSLVESLSTRTFDPARLFDACLIQLEEREHILAIAIHHIVGDGSSCALFLRELWIAYEDFIHCRKSSLPDVPLQYADYAVWQRDSFCYRREKYEEYWRRKLAGAVRIEWPVDSQPEPGRHHTVAGVSICFGEALSSSLSDLARREGTMPAMVVLALYACVILCWCKKGDLVIASTVDGRDSSAHANIMGCLAYPVFLRVQTTGTQTFSDFLKRVVEEFMAAWTHREFCQILGKMPEALGLFNTAVFQWQPWTSSEAGTPVEWDNATSSLEIHTFPFKSPLLSVRTGIDLLSYFSGGARGICGQIYYREDRLLSGSVQRLLRNLRLAAEYVVREPRVRIAEIGNWIGRAA